MDFRILGPLEVVDDGRTLELGGARQRALLAILLLHRNEVVPTDRLLEDLYGAEQPATAAKSLQAHVSRLRKALEGDRLLTRGSGYMLATDADEVDADRLAGLLDAGRSALVAGDASGAERSLEQALSLWRGATLDDVAFEDFAQTEIARLDELRLACVEELCEARLVLGRHAELIGELERHVAEQPLRERLRGQLMLALYRSGRQADSLATYRDAQRALVAELGLEPSRMLRDLERAILSQDPALDPPPLPRPPRTTGDAAGRRGAGVFVGRRRELDQLDAVLADARRGRGRLVLLSGDAGIGKSRLADELATRARGAGARVLWGRCWEAGGAPAYWPWVQALRTYVREAEPEALRAQLGNGAPDVAHVVPEVRELFPDLPEPLDLESEGARFRLFDSTAAFICRASEDEPILLVLDDLHVADTPSLLMLEFVTTAIADARVAVVALYRDVPRAPGDPAASPLGALARSAGLHLVLPGLDDLDIASFIELSTDVEPHPTLVAAITEETEGNALFVGEVVSMLAAEGRLDEVASAGWRPTLPASVKEVIGRRLHRLTPECVGVLEQASVVGREFPLEVLSRLSDRPTPELLGVLDEAISARIITDVPGAPGRLRFAHALVRDTLYDALPQTRRLELHRATAESIEATSGPDVTARLSELAHHLFLALPAVDAATAVSYARRAGDQAQSVLAHEEAARLYRTALQALELVTEPSPELECRLLISLGSAIMAAGDAPSAKDTFLRGVVIARSLGETELLAEAALGYGGLTIWSRAGEDPLIVALLEEALEALGAEETPLRARVLARLAAALRDEHDPARREALSELAVAIARRLGDDRILAHVLDGRSAAVLLRDNQHERLQIAEELIALGLRMGDPQVEFSGQTYAIVAQFDLANVPAALQHHPRLRELAEEVRQPARQWLSYAEQTFFDLHAGRFADAEAHALRARELGQVSQQVAAESAFVAHLFGLRREQGRLAEVEQDLERAADRFRVRPLFRSMLAFVQAELGRLPQARRSFEQLAAGDFRGVPPDMEWLLTMSLAGEVCVSLEDRERAAVIHRLLTPYAERPAVNLIEGSAGSVSRALGLLAELLGATDEAETRLRFAIEHNQALRSPSWEAWARFDLAELLLQRGDRDTATTLFEEADAIARSLEMTALAARIEAARAYAGGSPSQ
jgi:DNA-binding SARP family transcriptional activator/predicted ATPase